MKALMPRLLVALFFAILAGCSSDSQPPGQSSPNAALFDPTTSTVPLPNILATATAADPFLNYSGKVQLRPAGRPMNPLEALAYVNQREVGGTNAVSGLNAPIYLRFTRALDPATVTSANIKVFQLTPESSGLENAPLGLTDVSAQFSYHYGAGTSDLLLFPKFPLSPATRYLYLVTNRVKDAATGNAVSSSVYFEALKATVPLAGPFLALEAIRDNVYTDSTRSSIKLSGYAKVMDDLIAASATSTVSSRGQIALLGRFITTGAGFVLSDAASQASALPVESALRSFAAGAALGGLSGKSWTNTVSGAVSVPANAYWAQVLGAGATAPASVAAVELGSFDSADLSMDPVLVDAHPASMDLTGIAGADNPAAGVLRPFRSGATLTGFYHVPRAVPFVYLTPATPNGKLVIFQHGITGMKEQVVGVAAALTGAGYAVVAIDLPLHGALSPTHQIAGGDSALTIAQKQALWGQDFMAVGAPLATRSNIQQAAFNLDRLELAIRTGGFAPFAGAPPTEIRFVGISLGSIVGSYYLAGNTTLASSGLPYTQATLNGDMKGLLSVPGARLAYLMKDSPAFGASINQGLAQKGIVAGTPTYQQFFLLTQSVIDPADPASVTTPLAAGLPSRLSGRLLVQEATSTSFSSAAVPTNGDQVILNDYTRYFGNALGGRGALGSAAFDIAPGFSQLSYADGRTPAQFMYTTTAGALAPKTVPAATSAGASSPTEGYFQFDQADVTHGFLIDLAHSPTSLPLAQRQMVYLLNTGLVIDPTVVSASLPKAALGAAGLSYQVQVPRSMRILGKQ